MRNNTDKISDMLDQLDSLDSVKFYGDSFPAIVIKDDHDFFSFSERSGWLTQHILDAAYDGSRPKKWLLVATKGRDVVKYEIDIRDEAVMIFSHSEQNSQSRRALDESMLVLEDTGFYMDCDESYDAYESSFAG